MLKNLELTETRNVTGEGLTGLRGSASLESLYLSGSYVDSLKLFDWLKQHPQRKLNILALRNCPMVVPSHGLHKLLGQTKRVQTKDRAGNAKTARMSLGPIHNVTPNMHSSKVKFYKQSLRSYSRLL